MRKDIKIIDKFIVLKNAGCKVFRGFIKRLFLKEVHNLFFVGKNVVISHGKNIRCGKNVKFEDYSEIHGLCSEGIILGDFVTIGRGVMIRPSSYYGTSLGQGLIMGDNSSIGPYAYIGCAGKIIIGNNVMIGPSSKLFAESHIYSDLRKTIKSQGVTRKGIIIEDDCWIGSDVIILDGVKIGKGCIIGAGSVITKDIPSNSIVIDKRLQTIRERKDN